MNFCSSEQKTKWTVMKTYFNYVQVQIQHELFSSAVLKKGCIIRQKYRLPVHFLLFLTWEHWKVFDQFVKVSLRLSARWVVCHCHPCWQCHVLARYKNSMQTAGEWELLFTTAPESLAAIVLMNRTYGFHQGLNGSCLSTEVTGDIFL